MQNSLPASFPAEPRRKLSVWRLLLGILILAWISFGGYFGLKWWNSVQSAEAHKPWFAAYVDVTATPTYPFEQLGLTTTKNAVLSFIVASPTDPCVPSWGAAYTMDEAKEVLDLDRRIARLRQQNGQVTISFGGLLNHELAVACTDSERLLQAYTSVVEHYDLDTIDLDLEQSGLTDNEAGIRRAKTISKLQLNRRQADKPLAVWVTLPVAPAGLTKDGTNAIATLLEHGVDLAGVNVMTMDYGEGKAKDQSMHDASKEALIETHRQLGILYQQANIHLSSGALWGKIGATPMIGQNDVPAEIFSIDDAKNFNIFALSKSISRMSMWSANRDIACGQNYVDVKVVSDSCSGVDGEKYDFATALSKGFEGNIRSSAAKVTTASNKPAKLIADDPTTSPYRIWQDSGAYLQGTKVVWHGNVYEAKWWTQGDLPDNPVLQSWETPWKLVGPVLPGEKPVVQPTVPEGTYPIWSGDEKYETNQRVLFNGTPYHAKWWNQGQSPAAASSNADSSPWTPLTQTQINELLNN